MKIHERTVASIESKYALLKALQKSDDFNSINPAVLGSLQSQGDFAAFRSEDLGLTRLTLNAFIRASNILIHGGFYTVDSLRKEVLRRSKVVPKKSRERSDTRASLLLKIKYLEEQLLMAQESQMQLTYVICELRNKYLSIASIKPESVRARYEQDIGEIYATLAGLDLNILD
jgi:hypothetical protein